MTIADQALALLRANSPHGAALENHCLRLYALTDALARAEAEPIDRDLTLAGCWLHDIGLLVDQPDEPNYLRRGLAFVQPTIAGWGLSAGQKRVFEEILLYNHSLRRVPGSTDAAELFRRAVQVEHSLGLRHHGLGRGTYKDVVRDYPRLDFNRVLRVFFKTALWDDGIGHLPRIVLPKGK